MNTRKRIRAPWLSVPVLALVQACASGPSTDPASAAALSGIDEDLPAAFAFPGEAGGAGGAAVPWRDFFADAPLRGLIEEALANNQEQQLLLAELEVARNEAAARSGEYLPSAVLRAGAGKDKVGEYTREGAVEEQLDLREERSFPEPLPDYLVGIDVSWELDIWHQLRDAQKAAVLRYLATAEGRRFAQTHLVSEIAASYYELVALDRKAEILQQMIDIQQAALEAVRLQKRAGEVTELAVRRFEAELQRNRSERFRLQQEVLQTENRLNFLAGRFAGPVDRASASLSPDALAALSAGEPAALLASRPDVRAAELELAAAGLDVRVARARFYPSLGINAAIGFNAAEADLLFESPESLAYGFAADLVMPLLNRRGIEAAYNSANAMQHQALVRYRQTVLKAYLEVSNQLSLLDNLGGSIRTKQDQADALTRSIDIANRLFRSARADYTEVLLTQRDALEARMELIELEQQQIAALVRLYGLLGGGTESPAPEAG
jgi:NodT family efflux transporter outer membrane factor (OMF) lipoprotein